MKSCENCIHHKRRLGFLGWRPFCALYKVFRSLICIDWRKR